METDGYCLVLSGGCAKGIYYVGALRALRELGVRIDAVVGNSIGAIIAAFVAQGEYEAIEDIGRRIGIDYIVNVPKELVKNGELAVNLRKREAFRTFYRNTVSRKGLDTSPMRQLLEKHLDEEKIRRGGVDFGVVTYNVTDMKPREVFLEEMEPGELVSYTMASSAFPGFEQPEIAGKRYMDGGVFDNIPFAMARNRGYRSIIVIDISGMGINRKPNVIGSRTVYIKNSINMGGVLDFDREFMDRFMELGYLDTMRVFGRLRGINYFIEPDEAMEQAFRDFLDSDRGRDILMDRPSTGRAKKPTQTVVEAVRRLLPGAVRYNPNWLSLFSDCAAKTMGLERIRKWSYAGLFEALPEAEARLRAEADELAKSSRREIAPGLRKDLRARRLMTNPYVYELLEDWLVPERLRPSLERLVAEHYPELATGICFLEMLEDFRLYLEGVRL